MAAGVPSSFGRLNFFQQTSDSEVKVRRSSTTPNVDQPRHDNHSGSLCVRKTRLSHVEVSSVVPLHTFGANSGSDHFGGHLLHRGPPSTLLSTADSLS